MNTAIPMVRSPRASRLLTVAVLAATLAPEARADIREWEYINGNHFLGKQESTRLVPDGAGVDAVRGANLSNRDLTRAYLIGKDLTGASLNGANLTDADLEAANLLDADFSGAIVTGSNLMYTASWIRGFTKEQLYSTASYQAKNLSGITLSGDLAGWNFRGQNLANASLGSSDLTNANLSGANLVNAGFNGSTLANVDLSGAVVTGARFIQTTSGGFKKEQLYSTTSYQAKDLSGMVLDRNDLGGWDFRGQDLTGASLTSSALAGADLEGAVVTRAWLWNVTPGGFTKEQFYSTASYRAKDLSGMVLGLNDLSGWNFNGQNLTGARLNGSLLTGVDFTGAVVTEADFDGTGITRAQLYSTVDYQTKNLSSMRLGGNDLGGADFRGFDMTGVILNFTRLADADLRGATVRGASFYDTVSRGLTKEQLYSTASHQAKNLGAVTMGGNDLSGWDFSGQDLRGSSFENATLVGALLDGANLSGSTLQSADLNGADLRRANLTNALFYGATLANANLSGAIVTGTSFDNTTSRGFTKEQLYSTASYRAKELPGIWLANNDVSGWDFRGQNMTNARLFFTTLTDADFTGADMRGAKLSTGATVEDAVITNLIRPDGRIAGLDLTAGAFLVVRDYDGDPTAFPPSGPLPIVIEQRLAINASAMLALVFDADPWDSRISFAAGIPVARGGTLNLDFAADVDPAGQVGRTIDLFDWAGVAPSGIFDIESAYLWDVSDLYTTGQVTLVGVPEPGLAALAAIAAGAMLCRRGGRASRRSHLDA